MALVEWHPCQLFAHQEKALRQCWRAPARGAIVSNGDLMSENEKSRLEKRIRENQQKIEEMSPFGDDPKFARIIRAIQKQIAHDTYALSLLQNSE